MAILYPYQYPPTEPDIDTLLEYILPYGTMLGYSRGSIGNDNYYLPDRLFPAGVEGQVRTFTSPHINQAGLYPAYTRASQVLVTSSNLYGFEDVSADTIAIVASTASVRIGYIGVDDGELHTIGPVTCRLVDTVPMTEVIGEQTIPGEVSLRQQLAGRYTATVNNLPKRITTITQASISGILQLYVPPEGTGFSYLTIAIRNDSEDTQIGSLFFTSVLGVSSTILQLRPGQEFIMENIWVIGSETVSLSMDGVSVKASAAHILR